VRRVGDVGRANERARKVHRRYSSPLCLSLSSPDIRSLNARWLMSLPWCTRRASGTRRYEETIAR
jgi:hypothetical protein